PSALSLSPPLYASSLFPYTTLFRSNGVRVPFEPAQTGVYLPVRREGQGRVSVVPGERLLPALFAAGECRRVVVRVLQPAGLARGNAGREPEPRLVATALRLPARGIRVVEDDPQIPGDLPVRRPRRGGLCPEPRIVGHSVHGLHLYAQLRDEPRSDYRMRLHRLHRRAAHELRGGRS